MRKFTLFLLCMGLLITQLQAQSKKITGKVTDEKGVPLEGASVTVKGTTTGITTGVDGNFSLSIPATAKSLVVTALNFEAQEMSLSSKSEFSVQLVSSSKSLEDVVVIAYGTQSRVRTTSSQVNLKGTQFAASPISSIDAMLQGKAAGLQSVATSGQPGALSQIRIRGIGSINAGAGPLFVIDGVPVITGDASQITPTSNLLAGFNADDIEDISVLKDAAATAIYGSRGSNGVVLITTKSGKSGKAKFSVTTELGNNDIAYFPDLATPLNKEELKSLTTEGLRNIGTAQADIDNIINQYGFNSTANYNWLDLTKRKGLQQQVNASVSGGNNNTTFYLSGGYFRQQAPVIGSDFKRYSAAFRGTFKATEKLSFGASINLSTFNQNGESEGSSFRNPVFSALALRPSQEAYRADGTPEYNRTIFEQLFNPLAIVSYDRRINSTSKVLGNFDVTYKILPSLSFRGKYGIDYSNLEENRYLNPFFGDARPPVNGSVTVSYNRIFNYIASALLEYNKRFFNSKLDVNVIAGHESQKTTGNIILSTGTGVPLTTSVINPSVSTPTSTTPLSTTENSLESYLSRAILTYDNKYNLSLSLRADGASRFAESNRWGTFWSVGGSWNIDREKFFSPVKFFSYLKLRSSYGTSGNNNLGDYDFRSTYTFANTTLAANGIAASANYNGQPASAPGNVGNPNLTWEKSKSFDIGIDAGLFKNRVTFEVSYYNRETYDLLLNEPLSPTSGFTTFSNNVGSMQNRGIEISANFIPVQTRDFKWEIGFNASFNKNKILSLSSTGADIVALPNVRRVGEDFQTILTRLWAGADPANGNPLWYTDGTKSATTSDFTKVTRVTVGSTSPKGFGGANTSFTYKNFSVSANFYFQYGNLINDNWGFLYTSDGASPNLNKNKKQLRRWQKAGDITDIPRYDFNNATSSNAVSTRYFYKGDFIRLRSLLVSYNLPSSLLKKWNIGGVNFYVRGNNIYTKTFDDNLTVEPEQPVTGLANNQFFIPKSYTVGLNITF